MGFLVNWTSRLIKHFTEADNFTMFTTFFVSLIFYALYKLATRPLNRIRLLGDIGFDFNKKLKGNYRERQLARLHRLRRKADFPPVYPNGWYCIAESNDVKPGEIKGITVFGKILSLTRSQSGKIFVTDSYCPHLGASFNVGGRVVNDSCIQCPFHGWVFSAETGKCIQIPYSQQSIPPQAKVETYHAVERNMHIYLWFHCDNKWPEWEVPEIEQIDSGEWTYGGRTEHEIMCHIQEIPENGADIAHLNYLHLSGPNDGANIMEFELNNTQPIIQHCWDGSWTHGREEDGTEHIGVMLLNQHLTFYGHNIPLTSSKLTAEQHGPGIVVMRFDFGILGRGVVLQHVTPEEPLQQRVRFKMYSTCPLWFCKFFLVSEATQFERDVYIWSNKKYIHSPPIVRSDGPIGEHRRWFRKFYLDNSPKLQANGLTNVQEESHDW